MVLGSGANRLPTTMELNWYEVLGLPRTATPDQIAARYRVLAKRYHPDKAGEGDPWPARLMPLINQAHKVLSDAATRAEYDARISQPKPPREAPPRETAAPQEAGEAPAATAPTPIPFTIPPIVPPEVLRWIERGAKFVRRIQGDADGTS